MKLRLTVYDAALDTATDASLGLYNGDLLWGYGYTDSNYKAGFIDRTSFGGLTQSAANVTSGGTYSNGFTDVISVSVATSEVYDAWKAETITLQGRYVRLEVFFTVWTTVFYQRVTAIEPVSQFELRLLLNNVTALDTTKVPFTVVTREMALNSDSEAVGQEILPSYGNYVYYKMVFCETPNTIGAMVYKYQGASDSSLQLWTGSAPQLGTTSDTYELAVPDLSFMRGKSLLQCVGAWQAEANSPVWIALSYNGKELLATINMNTREDLMRRALVGKRLKGVHGNSKDASFLIIDVAWATHEVTWDTTDITTLWIQVDSVDINSFTYALPNWTSGALGDGTRSLHLNTLLQGNAVINNVLSVKRDDAFLSAVTYLSFEQPNAGIFIVPVEADINDCTVYQKVDGYPGYLEVALPSGIEVIYTSERWKMLSIAMRAEFGTDAGDFQQSQPIDHDSYVLENFDGTGFGQNLNITSAGIYMTNDGLAQSLTLLTPTGFTPTVRNYEQAAMRLQNTYFTPWSSSLLQDKLSLRLMPNIDYTWDSNVFMAAYTAQLTVDIYAVSESNIAIAKRSHTLSLSFVNGGGNLQRIQIDADNGLIVVSSNCTSQEASSQAAFQRMAQALTFSADELPINKAQLNGFVVSVYVNYNLDQGAPTLITDLTKVIKPLAISQTQKADKKNLWLRSRKDAAVTTPLGIVLSIAQELGVPVNAASFIDAQIAQRTYFSTAPELFDGVYIPQSSDSFSSIIDAIGKATLTAIYLDAVGVLHAKFLPTEPADVSASFDVDSVEKNSDSYSMAKNGYLYTDYDFTILRNPLATAETVAIDTDSFTAFPAEEDTPLGSIVFSSGTGYTIEQFHFDGTTPTTWISAIVRGASMALFALFVPGTIWSFTRFTQKLTCRLDSCAPDIGNALVTQDGIGLLFKILNIETITDVGITLRTFGPNPEWRKAVSGALVDNYALSQAIWDYAKAARAIAGTEIKAPTEITQLLQPIWGSDTVAITNWITETVKYGSTQKLLIKFSAVYDENTVTLQYMDFVSYNFGAFATAPIVGLVIERSLDLEKSRVSYTLLCKGDSDMLPAILTELDESIVLESGPLLEPENPTAGSTKISELPVASPEAAATAGAYTVVAITNVSNSRVALSAIKTWVYDDVMSATTDLIATKANDGAVVHKSGDESIAGVKVFTTAPLVPNNAWTIAKTTGLQNALDDKISRSTTTAQTIVGDIDIHKALGVSVSRVTSPNGDVFIQSSVGNSDAVLNVAFISGGSAQIAVNETSSQIALAAPSGRVLSLNTDGGFSDTGLTANQWIKTNADKELVSVSPTTLSGFGITDAIDTSTTSQAKAGILTIHRAGEVVAFQTTKDGDTVTDFALYTSGLMQWGGGSASRDLAFGRTGSAEGTLTGSLIVTQGATLKHAGNTRIATTTAGAKVTGLLEVVTGSVSVARESSTFGGYQVFSDSSSNANTLFGSFGTFGNLNIYERTAGKDVQIATVSGVIKLGTSASANGVMTITRFETTSTGTKVTGTAEATNASKTTQASTTTTGSVAWNMASGGILHLSSPLTGALTVDITNPVAGSKCELLFIQGSSHQVLTLSCTGVVFRQTRSTVTGTGTMALTLDVMANGFYRVTLEWISTTLCNVVVS